MAVTLAATAWIIPQTAMADRVKPDVSLDGQAAAGVVRSSFVRLGMGVPGVLYQPARPGPKASLAVLVMHPEGDYLAAAPCTELSKRGYSVLCVNSSVSKPASSADFSIDLVLRETRLAVAYLRSRPDMRKIVLLGHSGGGSLMSLYQDIAENGVRVCQDGNKIQPCPDKLAGLPPADGIMLIDSNFGLPVMMALSLDGAVVQEGVGTRLEPALNLFNPANGYRKGASAYPADFVRRWQQAVARRNNRLVTQALERVAAIKAGQGAYVDDEIMVVPGASYGAFNNKLFAQDPRLLSHTKAAWPLLHKDGRETREIVHSVRVPENDDAFTASYEDGTLQTTARHFLSTFAIHLGESFTIGEDGLNGIDWASSYDTPEFAVRGVSVPVLTMGMTGHWEFLATEAIYDNASSRDKSIAFVEGATHLFSTCKECEKAPGQFGDTMKTTFDYVDRWLSASGRFLAIGTSDAP